MIVDSIRKVVAVVLWLLGSYVLVSYGILSIRIANKAIRGQKTFEKNPNLPVRSGVRFAIGILALILGTALWYPGFFSLSFFLPCSLLAAVGVGISVWLNMRIRQHYE